MKSRLSWILLAIYLNASAQALLPLVKDALAHLLFWQEHLAQAHHGHVHSDHVILEIEAQNQQHDQQHPLPQSVAFAGKNFLSAHLLPCVLVSAIYPETHTATPIPFERLWRKSLPTEVMVPPPDRA